MDINKASARISELTKIINYHNNLYYVQDSPEIDDYEYDILMQELKKLEQEFPELVLSDSPTQRVGGESSNQFQKVIHKVQMGSVITSYSIHYTKLYDNNVIYSRRYLDLFAAFNL